jgi:mono/diheme cytochrome c family protein
MRKTWSVVGAVLLGSAFGCSADSSDARDDATVDGTTSEDAVTVASLLRGSAFFLNEFPGVRGNGRACATCHVPQLSFALTPAHVEARYRALQALRVFFPQADDPLFRSIDADDGHENYTTLRKHALIRVNVKLPENSNIWLTNAPQQRTVTVLRAVPTAQNVKFTAPYQSDSSAATLQLQAMGALKGHAQIQHDPKPEHLDAVADFESQLFSSPWAARQMDPPLNALEKKGKDIFDKACANCHGGKSQSVPQPDPDAPPGTPPAPQDVLVSRPLPPPAAAIDGFTRSDLPVQMWSVRLPDGTVEQRPSTDPGKMLVTNNLDDFNVFDTPQLRGIRNTAPYFHDNSAADLDEVLRHYAAFFKFLSKVGVPVPPVTEDDFAPLKAYLRKI